MPTISYPAYGNGGLTAAQWSTMYSYPDGIVNDYSGDGCVLTLVSANTIARVSPGYVRINGYTLEITADTDLTIPTTVGTNYVVGMYDPNLNVADAEGNALPAGPCRLMILPTLDLSNGKAYTMMYRLVRATANGPIVVDKHAQHIGDSFSVHVMPSFKLANPEINYNGWAHPLGSTVYERSTGEIYDKVLNATGNPYWKKRSIEGPFPLPVHSSLISDPGTPASYYLTDNGTMCHLEGTLKRSSGAALTNGADVTLSTSLPARATPEIQNRFSCVGPAPVKWRNVQVTARPDGILILYDPFDAEISYIDLSGISYRVKGR